MSGGRDSRKGRPPHTGRLGPWDQILGPAVGWIPGQQGGKKERKDSVMLLSNSTNIVYHYKLLKHETYFPQQPQAFLSHKQQSVPFNTNSYLQMNTSPTSGSEQIHKPHPNGFTFYIYISRSNAVPPYVCS